MGPPSYMRSAVDRKVVMRPIPVYPRVSYAALNKRRIFVLFAPRAREFPLL